MALAQMKWHSQGNVCVQDARLVLGHSVVSVHSHSQPPQPAPMQTPSGSKKTSLLDGDDPSEGDAVTPSRQRSVAVSLVESLLPGLRTLRCL